MAQMLSHDVVNRLVAHRKTPRASHFLQGGTGQRSGRDAAFLEDAKRNDCNTP